MDKSVQKMQGWRQKLLSQAGREISIKSVFQNFWWGRNPEERGIHRDSWDNKLSQSKPKEGMGFRDSRGLN
ncbi:hypothetical protein RHSIM_Rhsim05G0075600 [Rhododendron simsii]|uniref:Uncharacterized protein n=1 Tax=Rhododendron simsii TaxID=118357 RepID=A0A834LK80_RHOSS|nr:hypothetical protein RHSIM_Rhsim05G0075600 [Rhododendron simsii]